MDAPALLTVGEHDAVRPLEHTLEVAGELRHSRVEVVPRAGRRPFRDAPNRYGGLVEDFLIAEAATLELSAIA